MISGMPRGERWIKEKPSSAKVAHFETGGSVAMCSLIEAAEKDILYSKAGISDRVFM